ncbi:glycosyltransferase family 2 protein [Hyphomonas sp. BRH_c22]|uniref:glycosyltransferase family 2 protein n=1 Tax=Hyphomonas sp. BRH_c22 TaxID=1629710 RepID=UPI000A5E999C|nr:glycosyltransferase family 2 protein [Hyphomonas sp. BRH_c22]
MSCQFVTVLIPTYNRSELLLATLASVFAQSRLPDEIVVINDGSTDDTLKRLSTLGDRVRILTQENQGKSAALNLGLRHARDGLIWIVDDDDLMNPDALQTLIDLFDRDPDAEFAYGRHERFSAKPSGEIRRFDTGYWCECLPDEFLIATMEDMFVHQPGMLVRKSLYDRVGPFDINRARSQDYEMLIRLARAAKVASTEDVVFLQRVHDGERGAGARAISSDQRDSKWVENDQSIFRNIYASFDLEEYIPPHKELVGPAALRYALLSRGAIMARKKLWDLAIEDFSAARDLTKDPLSEAESSIIWRSLAGKYGCDEIITDRSLMLALERLADGSRPGSQIASSLALGLRWRVWSELRGGHMLKALALFLCMTRLRFAGAFRVKRDI